MRLRWAIELNKELIDIERKFDKISETVKNILKCNCFKISKQERRNEWINLMNEFMTFILPSLTISAAMLLLMIIAPFFFCSEDSKKGYLYSSYEALKRLNVEFIFSAHAFYHADCYTSHKKYIMQTNFKKYKSFRAIFHMAIYNNDVCIYMSSKLWEYCKINF